MDEEVPPFEIAVLASAGVVRAGDHEQVEHLVRLNQRIDDLHRRGGIDVGIHLADDEQQLALQQVCVVHVGRRRIREAPQLSTLRWEDYLQTAMDPSDDCTIWYVGDYLKQGAMNYSTRIGAFRMPGCPSAP